MIDEGILARIVHSLAYPESIGWVVIVGRRYGFDTTNKCDEFFIHHPPLGIYSLTDTICPSKWLEPIDGGETKKQSIEAMKLLHQLPKETV